MTRDGQASGTAMQDLEPNGRVSFDKLEIPLDFSLNFSESSPFSTYQHVHNT